MKTNIFLSIVGVIALALIIATGQQAPAPSYTHGDAGWYDYVDVASQTTPQALATDTAVSLQNDMQAGPGRHPQGIASFYASATLDYDGETLPFSVGETVTGTTSLATGVIVKLTSTRLFLKDETGTFQNDEAITSAGGAAVVNGVLGDGRILGSEGDFYVVTISFDATPTAAGTTILELWFDIEGSIGELYRRTVSFPKGIGVVRAVTYTTAIYTLDTWESNGALVKIVANDTCDIENVRFVIGRIYKDR